MAGVRRDHERVVPGVVPRELHLVDGDAPGEPDAVPLAVAVSVVIPCRNEAMNLPAVLSQLRTVPAEVIIVDGGSTDGTAAVARQLLPGAVVVRQRGRGKGDALRTGFAVATGDVIVMLDGDGSMSPGEMDAFVKALAGGADMVKGSRQLPGGGSADLTLVRAIGNRMLGLFFNRIFATQHTDLCYGYLAFWKRHLDVLMPDCPGFEVESWMCARAHRAGLRVAEVPSHEGRRIYGDSNLRTFRDGARVVRLLVREWWSMSRGRWTAARGRA